MPLSPRENFLEMVQRRSPQRLPLFMNFTPPVREMVRRETGCDDPAEVLKLDFRAAWGAEDSDTRAWRAALEGLGFSIPADAQVGYCGITHRIPRRDSLGAATHLREMMHPLEVVQDVAQLKSLPWPTHTQADADRLRRHVAQCREEGRAAVVSMECTLFEHSWYLRGMDNLFADLFEGNGIADWLLDRFTDRSIRAVTLACDAGADVVGLGDDIGTQRGMMMAPDFWRQHLKPRLRRVIDAVRAADRANGRRTWVRYHSDGDIRNVIGDLVEIGVDILNPVQPECMPLEEVVPRWKDQIAFWGMIGTQTVMPFGTIEDVRRAVSACHDAAARGAAVIVAPTHVLEPDVPWRNICALSQAAHEARLS